MTTRVHATALRAVLAPRVLTDPDLLTGVAEDASHFPGGRPSGLVRPACEAELAAALRAASDAGVRVLAIGAQSSLTGGAVPIEDRVLATRALAHIGEPRASGDAATVRVQAGVLLEELQAAVGARGWYYPPVPTYQQACVGGTVSTNAAGSATFKYGPTRPWVRAMRVLTVDGALLQITRGQHVTQAGGAFDLVLPDGSVRALPVPAYPMPRVKKASIGYWSAPEVDLIDLFIGSEGTLGVVTEVELGLVRKPAGVLAALVFAPDEGAAIELAGEVRAAAAVSRPGSALDVRAIEHMDAASLDLVRARGIARRLRVTLPPGARMALYMELELPAGVDDAAVLRDLEAVLDGGAPASGPGALFALLARRGLLESLELAMPGEPARQAAFREVRESVPLAVNETVGERKRTCDPGIAKLGGDMCVPFECFAELTAIQRAELTARGLEHVVFGHISDGNVHPNVLARSVAEMKSGREALLAIAARVKEMGGSPLAEHGVGRSPLKQLMMFRYHGVHAINAMRELKSALDPRGLLARDVLFPWL